MEAAIFVLANLFMGVVMLWVLVEDAKGEKGGRTGWFAFRAPMSEPGDQSASENQKPKTRGPRHRR